VVSLSSIAGDETDVIRERPFQLLLLTNILPPLGTSLLSPVLESLIEPLGTSTANIGLMMAAYTAPSIVMIPIAGVIADRYGRRRVILFGLLCFGAAGTALALAPDFRTALFLRFLQGIGFAALTPIIIASIGDLYSGTKEATAQGLRFTGSGIASASAPLFAGSLVSIAWQYPFLIYTIAFPIAVVIYVWFEEPIDTDAHVESDEESLKTQLKRLWTLVSHRRAAAVVVGRGMTSLIWIGFLTYNSIIVVTVMGGTPTHAGLLAALASAGYGFSATQTGRITSYFDSRLAPLATMNVAMGVGVSVVFVAEELPMAYVGVTVMGIGFGVTLSLYRSILTEMAPASLRGGLVSLAEGNGRVTGTITPVVMGAAIALATPQFGFDLSVRAVGTVTGLFGAGIGILCLFVIRQSPPIEIEGITPPDDD
jgi:MFS family permease